MVLHSWLVTYLCILLPASYDLHTLLTIASRSVYWDVAWTIGPGSKAEDLESQQPRDEGQKEGFPPDEIRLPKEEELKRDNPLAYERTAVLQR